MSLLIDVRTDLEPGLEPWLREVTATCLREELRADAEVSLVLCNDAEIAAYNLAYLGHEGATDVISFPQLELVPPAAGQVAAGEPLGDILISADTAAAQAAGYSDWSPRAELTLLLIHGFLHLCGHDDLEPAAREVMRRREDELLAAVGLPPAPRD